VTLYNTSTTASADPVASGLVNRLLVSQAQGQGAGINLLHPFHLEIRAFMPTRALLALALAY
jgi:hypothetical protein